MHPYRPTDASAPILAQATELARDVLARHAAAVDLSARFPEEGLAALGARGLLGLCVAREQGGRGEGMRTFAAVVEELATGCASTSMIYVMHVAAAQAIASGATLGGRNALLGSIASGKHLTTLAFSERGSRSQFWAPVSRLVESNGSFRTRAEKSWVTSAGHADSYVSSALAPGATSPLESTVYVVRRAAPGVEVRGAFDGLGLRGNESSSVTLADVAVGKDDFISPPGEGAATMLNVVLPWFSVGTAAMANGLARAALATTIAHVSGATFEHTGTQLRDLPTLRARVAEMAVRTEQSRALLGHTLDHLESGSAAAPLFVLQARLAALQAAWDVTDLAMKACGGAAFSKHLGLERVFRDARAGWVMAPTVDHLLEFSGRALTGLPLFA
ncbi:MAG TPA: acyl-CoA dehydrogenase family protein [Candidatus Saccharimonadaceae bacterium]|jgi:alkylation response protein AidB-like acyl-CoA dehydrogenase|nr:acyl-CoA dehydrogenase family protein [Candidatus Saccharimonadaceae bacterium]